MAEIIDVDSFEEDLDDNIPDDYRDFRDNESIPVHTGLYVKDINEVETGAWDRTDQYGAFVNMYGAEGVDDLQIHELEPSGETVQQNHLYEEVVLVTQGQGLTALGADGDTVFEWEENSLFFIPPNTPYKHVNTSENSSARLVSQTPLPELMNVIKDRDLIFPSVEDVGDLKLDYDYTGEGMLYDEDDGSISWDANFIPDILRFDKIQTWDKLGSLRFVRLMLQSSMGAHIGEIPAQMYKNAHRHGPGASVFVLSGEGYSLLWREGWDKKIRLDWEPWSVFAPPARWFHQHFNLHPESARTFAVHCPDLGTLNTNSTFAHYHPDNVIDYVDEDHVIREMFAEELQKHDLESDMPQQCYTDPDYSFTYRE